MSILSQLSRRFHDMLTTDAKPDPPRIRIEGYTHDLPPTQNEELRKTQSGSMPTVPEMEHENVTSMPREKSESDDATPADFSADLEDSGHTRPTSESKEYKRPRTKTKSKHSKYSQATSVVNYNIVNSNGVKIGSRTSYVCNVNQYPASNPSSAQSEASGSKPKHRSMPEVVEELSTSDEELTFDDMFLIKNHIGRGWRDVARGLAYSEGQIDQFEENYRHEGVDEVIYQLLLDWKQANTRDAQLGTLISVLWSCQEYDCVERLVAERKTSV